MATIRKLRNRWQAQVRKKGAPLGAKSFDRRADAERRARDLEAEADRSGWVADTRLAERTALGELLARYRDEITPTKRSATTERAKLEGIIRRDISHRTLAKLASRDLARYRDERLRSVAPATVVRELNIISHALKVAQREWGVFLPRNPVELVRRSKVANGRKRRLEACDLGRTRFLRPLLILVIETAMRRGELLGPRWSDVDLQHRVAHLELTKNGHSRDVPLLLRATKTLEQLAADPRRDPVRALPMSPNSVRLVFERLRARAGLENLHLHDLRHESISRLFERGLNVAEVAAISGHKELRMLARYTHLRTADLVQHLG